MSVITVKNLSCSFGNHTVLDHLDIEVEEGEVVVIVGRSGSGKSVLFQHLLGKMPPQSGQVKVLGQKPNIDNPPEELGVVFQNAALLDDLTVEENIELALPMAADSDRVMRLLAEVGLDKSCLRKRPSEISGGMQKRVAAARALSRDPKLLLFDEPTAGLDAISTNQIAELIVSLRKTNSQISFVVITHDYGFSAKIADRILFLDTEKGRLVSVLSKQQIDQAHRTAPQRWEEDLRNGLETHFEQVDQVSKSKITSVSGVRDSKKGSTSKDIVSFIENTFSIIGEILFVPFKLRAPYRWRLVSELFGELSLGSAILMASAVGVFAGLMMVIQTATALTDLGNQGIFPEILATSFLRELGPLLTGVFLAGRNGAGIAAATGSKVLSQQIDALQVMRVSPRSWILGPVIIAIIPGQILMTVFMTITGLLTGLLFMGVAPMNLNVSQVWDGYLGAMTYANFTEFTIKSLIFGYLIGSSAWVIGMLPKKGTEDLGQHTRSAVLWGSFLVVVADVSISSVCRL